MRDRERGSARGQMQKSSSARKFHFEPPFTSLDHLVGKQLNRVRHLNAECPCRLQVDDELELAGLQNRQVGGLRALEDSTGVDADLMPRLQTIGPNRSRESHSASRASQIARAG